MDDGQDTHNQIRAEGNNMILSVANLAATAIVIIGCAFAGMCGCGIVQDGYWFVDVPDGAGFQWGGIVGVGADKYRTHEIGHADQHIEYQNEYLYRVAAPSVVCNGLSRLGIISWKTYRNLEWEKDATLRGAAKGL